MRRVTPIAIASLLLLLVGCIRPETTQTPTPAAVVNVVTSPPSSTPLPSQGGGTTIAPGEQGTANPSTGLSQTDVNAIQIYIQTQAGRTINPGTLYVWRLLQVPSLLQEWVIAFSYQNPSSLPCVGAAMARRDEAGNLVVFNGDAACGEVGARVIAGSFLFVTWQTAEPLTATVAHNLAPTESIGAATIFYPDGAQVPVSFENIVENRFLSIRTGLSKAIQVQFITTGGNLAESINLQ